MEGVNIHIFGSNSPSSSLCNYFEKFHQHTQKFPGISGITSDFDSTKFPREALEADLEKFLCDAEFNTFGIILAVSGCGKSTAVRRVLLNSKMTGAVYFEFPSIPSLWVKACATTASSPFPPNELTQTSPVEEEVVDNFLGDLVVGIHP